MWAIIILYFWINYWVLPVGEIVFDETNDYLAIIVHEQGVSYATGDVNQYIDEAVQEMKWAIVSWTIHNVAMNEEVYQERYQTICISDLVLCGKVHWVWEFTFKEKYLYLSTVFKVVHFVQDHAVVGNDIVGVLRSITIDNSVGNRRWYATWDEIVLNLWSVSSSVEFVGLVSHELGHIVDLWSIQGSSERKHWSFTEFGKKVFSEDDPSLDYYAISRKSEMIRKSWVNKKDFCSGYGMSDPFEDMAECFNLYMQHNALFKAIAKRNESLKKKYNYIATVFDWQFMDESSSDLDVGDLSSRPWDTTRING